VDASEHGALVRPFLVILGAVPQNLFVGRVAVGYDASSPAMDDPSLVEKTSEFLATTARGGRALEFGIGTGRVALPLSRRGIEVAGIDISQDMIDQLHRKPGADAITTIVGDFATTVVPGEFALVYIVYNSISNLLEQSEWVATFHNAARHLTPGGRFVLELWVPDLRRFPPGSAAVPFDISPHHVGFDTLDVATQRGVSHHYHFVDGRVDRFESPFRYAWPAELDLMAEIAGLALCERWANWDRSRFTSDSPMHVSVWEKGIDSAAAPN
jgi:SAM-dependent methyltransferase